MYSRERNLKEIYYNLITKRTGMYYEDAHRLADELAANTTLYIDLHEGVDDAGRTIRQ